MVRRFFVGSPMLSTLRNGLNSWVAKLFFFFLVALFVAWGVGSDVLRLITGGMADTSAATVGGHRIEMPELQDAYRRQLAQAMRMFPNQTDPTPEIKRGIAEQALARLVTQAALTQYADRMGLAVPDDLLRAAVFQMPAFRGPGGQFDRTVFMQVLTNNSLSEGRFMALMRQDMLHRQLLEPVRAGAVAPDVLTREIYAFQQEKRVADAVDLPFAAAPVPPAPTEAELKRWYDTHPDLYSTPEMRRIKAVVLAPDTVASEVQVTDDDLHGAFEQAKASYNLPETRSAEVLVLPDEAKATAIAEQWKAGADWTAIQAAAAAAGGTPVDLTDSAREQIPSPELAEAVFTATPDTVGPPVHTALGWYVLKVTKVSPASSKTFEQARDDLRGRVLADKATDLIYDRANKIEDLLAGGVTLDDLPGDLGLAAVTGTLDAQGNTEEGKPAPIPGGEAVRAALVQAAFELKPGDPPRFVQAAAQGSGSQAFYALVVENIIPPTPRPFDEVAERVRTDWTHDAIRHSQEEAAAKILTAVKAGTPLALAAAGMEVRQLPAAGRSSPTEGVPLQLVNPLFSLKTGEATMVETADGFVVAVLTAIETPDAAADAIGFGRIRDALTQAIGNDMEVVFTNAVREHAQPRINRPIVDSLTRSD
jgi:peptidyl-prolyl cis-trans isomerase D